MTGILSCGWPVVCCAGAGVADVEGKWSSSSWGRKLIVQKRRAALTDFERFKIMTARMKVRCMLQPGVSEL